MQQVTELLKAAGEFLAGLGAVIAPIATVVIALHRKPEPRRPPRSPAYPRTSSVPPPRQVSERPGAQRQHACRYRVSGQPGGERAERHDQRA